jgi:hypothetical protein
VHEDGFAGELGDPQHLTHGVPAVWVAQQGRRQLDADERSGQQLGEPIQVRLPRRDRRPGREVARQVERGAVPGVDERARLPSRQRLDPERGREADAGEPDPCLAVLLDAPADLVVARPDLVRRRPLGDQLPVTEVRRARAASERLEERLRPQVLMQVDRHHDTPFLE